MEAATITIESMRIEHDGGVAVVDNPLEETDVYIEVNLNDGTRESYRIHDFLSSDDNNNINAVSLSGFQELDNLLEDTPLSLTTVQDLKEKLTEISPEVIEYVMKFKFKELRVMVPIFIPELEESADCEAEYWNDDDQDMIIYYYYDIESVNETEFYGPAEQVEIDQLRSFEEAQPYTIEPASRASIESLERVKLDEADLITIESVYPCLVCTRKQCSICCDLMEVDNAGSEEKAAALKMPCSHIFHYECLVRWLELQNTCPLCRYQMPS